MALLHRVWLWQAGLKELFVCQASVYSSLTLDGTDVCTLLWEKQTLGFFFFVQFWLFCGMHWRKVEKWQATDMAWKNCKCFCEVYLFVSWYKFIKKVKKNQSCIFRFARIYSLAHDDIIYLLMKSVFPMFLVTFPSCMIKSPCVRQIFRKRIARSSLPHMSG